MTQFVSVKIPASARAKLQEIREHLSKKLGCEVSGGQAMTAAIDTLHRLSLDRSLRILSDETLKKVARDVSDELNRRTVQTVASAVRDITGEEIEVQVSSDGRAYTLRGAERTVVLADNQTDILSAFAAMN